MVLKVLGQLSPVSGAQSIHTKLLTDGTLLFHCFNGANVILSPDQFGNYENGTLTRMADSVIHSAACFSIANDGRLWMHSGEHNYTPNAIVTTTIYDPRKKTFTATVGNHVGYHNSVICDRYGTQWGYIRKAPASTKAPSQNMSLTSWENLLALPGDTQVFSESGFILLPDDSFAVIHAITGHYSDVVVRLRIEPKWTRFHPILFYIGTGSFKTQVELANQNHWKFRGATLPNPYWDQRPEVDGSVGKWTSFDPSCPYEIGATIWMPKIGKIVLIGGEGSIWTFDVGPNNSITNPVRAAELPMNQGVTSVVGRIPASLNGVNVATAISSGTFLVEVDNPTTWIDAFNSPTLTKNWDEGWTGWKKAIWVRLLNNTRWVRISFESCQVSANPNQIQLNGCRLSRYHGDDQSPLATNDEVVWGRPDYVAQDQGLAIDVNGDLIFAASTDLFAYTGFSNHPAVFRWDGTNPPEVLHKSGDLIDGHNVSWSSSRMEFVNLPDGSIYINGGSHIVVYKPDVINIQNSYRPTITSVPNTVLAGQKFTLSGTQLCGIHEGSTYGDDSSPSTNYPIVRLTKGTNVVYCRTRDFTYRGIGLNVQSSCNVEVPENIEPGVYKIEVIASGVPSTTQINIKVIGSDGDTIDLPYKQ